MRSFSPFLAVKAWRVAHRRMDVSNQKGQRLKHVKGCNPRASYMSFAAGNGHRAAARLVHYILDSAPAGMSFFVAGGVDEHRFGDGAQAHRQGFCARKGHVCHNFRERDPGIGVSVKNCSRHSRLLTLRAQSECRIALRELHVSGISSYTTKLHDAALSQTLAERIFGKKRTRLGAEDADRFLFLR